MTQLEFNFDEQTDDAIGFPFVLATDEPQLLVQPKLPPCTGYEADYEQTDDLQGFPTLDSPVDGRTDSLAIQPSNFAGRVPPCTGYESDYERTEAFFRSFE